MAGKVRSSRCDNRFAADLRHNSKVAFHLDSDLDCGPDLDSDLERIRLCPRGVLKARRTTTIGALVKDIAMDRMGEKAAAVEVDHAGKLADTIAQDLLRYSARASVPDPGKGLVQTFAVVAVEGLAVRASVEVSVWGPVGAAPVADLAKLAVKSSVVDLTSVAVGKRWMVAHAVMV